MGTIDDNGIYFYEDTDAVSPLHTLLNVGQQSISDAFDATARIFPVANVAARTALATAYSPTTSKPLYVHRADAGAAKELEYSTNGSTWTTVPAGYTAPITFAAYLGSETPGALGPNRQPIGGSTYTQPPTYQKVNNRVYLGGIVMNTASVALDATVAWLPVGFRPHPTADTNGRRRFIAPMSGTGVGTIDISGDGKIHGAGTGPGDNVSLDGISFEALG
jgi:hypothetical protein